MGLFDRKRTKPLVLHIDDDPAMHALVRAALEELDIDLVSENAPAAGISKAVSKKPDLVLLDINMPLIDGYDVCRAIKEKSRETVIVMLTSMDQMKDMEKALANGANSYVTKPFNINTLRAKVREMLKIPEPPAQS